jgi:biofilm PGA synthesis protein PgaA
MGWLRSLPEWRRLKAGLSLAAPMLVCVAASAPAQTPENSYSRAAHDAAVSSARDGSADTAAHSLDQLQAWLMQDLSPADRLRVQADSVVLATQAGQPVVALRDARSAPLAALPDYALDAVYRAARSVRDRDAEGEAVHLLIRRRPDLDAFLREVYWLVDEEDYDTAHAVLVVLEQDPANQATVRQRVQLFDARAMLEHARHNDALAFAAWTDALQLDPDDVEARRESTFWISEQGSPDRALHEAEAANARAAHPVFTSAEIAGLRQQATGEHVRWGARQRDTLPDAERWRELDQSLIDLDSQIAALDGHTDINSISLANRLQFDLLVALNERGRYVACTDLYEQMRQRGIQLPYYSEAAVANAYAQQRRSDLAVPLNEAALRDGGDSIPVPSDIHTGLAYAYLDTGHFEQMDLLVRQLERQTPVDLKQTPERGRPNPAYGEVQALRALLDLYSNRDASAQARLDRLSSLAPYNGAYRSGQAHMLGLRSHPYAALGRFAEALTDHPDNIDARAGYASALFDAGRIRQGMALANRLEQSNPEHPAVRDVIRYRNALSGPNIVAEASGGGGSGTISDYDWRSLARYSSALMDDQWRLFGEQFLGFGDTDIGHRLRSRSGAGVSWQKDGWNAELQATEVNYGQRSTGVAAAADYRATDHWQFSGSVDTNSNDVPLKAYVVGIAGTEYALGSTYIVNESRDFKLGVARIDYTDSNSHDGVSLAWHERWISQPRSILETWLSTDWGENQHPGRVYFSPRSDTSAELLTRYSYLTWKRDDREFTQNFYAGAGGYDQSGYGAKPLWDLRYEQRWSFHYAFDLHYGLGLLSHPYDGEQEQRWYGFVGVAMPLR